MEEASDILVDNGITRAPSLVGKETIVKALALHCTILRSKAELDQLKNGLHTLGVADAMATTPGLFEPFFTDSSIELSPGNCVYFTVKVAV